MSRQVKNIEKMDWYNSIMETQNGNVLKWTTDSSSKTSTSSEDLMLLRTKRKIG